MVSISFLLLMIIISFLVYRFEYSKFEQSTLMRLAGIANSLSLQIDGEEHAKLMSKYTEAATTLEIDKDISYQHIHHILKMNHDANMLKTAIYTVVMTDNLKYYEFGVTSDSTPIFRNKYNSYHNTLNENYNFGGIINAYKDEFGMWLSAFAPIKNKKGTTVAIVMVDTKFDDFLMTVRHQLMQLFFVSLAIFGIMMFGLMWVLRNILARENRDKISIASSLKENTEIKDELQIVNIKLKKLDTFRKEMISNISHDLRTPIASIMGFLDIVNTQKDTLSNAEISNYTNIAYKESNRLNNLVTNLFELTKLESGQIKLQKEPFNIYELVSDIIQKYELRIQAKNVKLHYKITQNLGLAFGDIKYIDRLFQNILDNAVKYVDEGGFIQISILDDLEKFKIKICNSGELLKKEDLELIFERYYLTEKSDNSSTGLGLAIAKNICLLHECTIRASTDDQVNSFWFTLPKLEK